MKTYKTVTPDYDVSGGDYEFESFTFEGKSFFGVQIFYSSLNQADHKIRLQESIDGINFIDSKDDAGNYIEITLDNTIPSDILKIYNFNSGFVRPKFIEGTAGTGTIDTIKMLFE